MNDRSQARKYQLTLNNPMQAGLSREKILEIIDSLTLDYFCLADEIATTGTPHTHIFLYSSSPIRFGTLKSKFPIAHIEKAYGTVKENRDYILKSGKWEKTEKKETVIEGSFYERGDMPSERYEKAPAMARLLDEVKNGDSTVGIIERNPNFAFRVKDIDVLRDKLLAERFMTENRRIEVHYIFGETGTGKTRSIYQKHSALDICRITNYKNDKASFDSYHGQDVLCFDEFRSQINISEMLNYLDVYPLMLPARYSDRVACFHTVYIVSNISIQKQYPEIQLNEPVTWKAFLRRISTITEYLQDGTQIIHDKEEYL